MKKLIFALCALLLLAGCSIPVASAANQGLTYSELVSFLAKDDTDQLPYIPTRFVCWDFAERLQNNATAKDIKSAVVTLGWSGSERSHVINAFETNDKGLIWVDSTGSHSPDIKGFDRILRPLQVGDVYCYEETGGGSPLKVELELVTYDWTTSKTASLR